MYIASMSFKVLPSLSYIVNMGLDMSPSYCCFSFSWPCIPEHAEAGSVEASADLDSYMLPLENENFPFMRARTRMFLCPEEVRSRKGEMAQEKLMPQADPDLQPTLETIVGLRTPLSRASP